MHFKISLIELAPSPYFSIINVNVEDINVFARFVERCLLKISTGLLVAYLQNKGFYKGFFYPEYRLFTGFPMKKKVH